MVIQWLFDGHSVVIRWSFDGYSVVKRWSGDGHKLVVIGPLTVKLPIMKKMINNCLTTE